MRSGRNAGVDQRLEHMRLRLAALRLDRIARRFLHEAGRVAERARVAGRRHQLGGGEAAHTGLDDRVLDPEEVAERGVDGHRAPLLATRADPGVGLAPGTGA